MPTPQSPSEASRPVDIFDSRLASPTGLVDYSQPSPNRLSPTPTTRMSRDGHSESDRPGSTTLTSPAVRNVQTQSWEYIAKSGIAGGVAGCVAKTIVGPLDRVKILFQASNPHFRKYSGSWSGVVAAMAHIRQSDGFTALFRGHSATLLRIFPYAGIKFLAYEQIRAVVIPDKSRETAVRRFAAGSLAGCLSVFFTYPLEVVRVRLAFDTSSSSSVDGSRRTSSRGSLARVSRQIFGETTGSSPTSQPSSRLGPSVKGLANFYRGFSATLYGMLPYAGSSFLVHDTMTDLLRHPSVSTYTVIVPTASHRGQLTHWAQLLAGGTAGFVSQTVSYPLEVIRRRMQVGAVVGDGHRLGLAEVATLIMRESGPRGFFVGLTIGYVKVVPMAAVSFYVYARMKWVLGI